MKRSALKSNSQLKSSSILKSNKPLQSRGLLNRGSGIKVRKKRINHKSNKQKDIEDKYHALKKIHFSEETLCTGCESSFSSTPSHLIPRSRSAELIAELKNIKPHCNTCHPKWESPRRVELLDYEENMEAIKEMDPEYYRMLRRDESY